MKVKELIELLLAYPEAEVKLVAPVKYKPFYSAGYFGRTKTLKSSAEVEAVKVGPRVITLSQEAIEAFAMDCDYSDGCCF